MTVSALVTRNDITATASQTSFTYTFRVLEATDMDVYQNGALLASGYTVNDVGVTTGGTVTLDVGVPVGQIVSLVLAMPLDRTTNYQNSGDFLAGDVNGDFDKIYIGAIQNENEGGRSLRLQDVEPPTAGVDMTIPLKADRLGKFLAFDDVTGGPIVSSGTGADAYDSAAWSAYNFTGNGSTTAFVLGISPHSENNTQVYIDGVYQQKDGYSLSASTITFSVAPPNLSTIEVMVTSALAVGSTSSDLVSYLPAGIGAVATTVQTKLRETVSVKDFGAVGDGIADDTAAITAFLAVVGNGGIGFMPAGDYVTSSLIAQSFINCKIYGVPNKTKITGSFGYSLLNILASNNVVFEDLIFETTYVNAADDAGTGIVQSQKVVTSDITFNRCTFTGSTSGCNGLAFYPRTLVGDTAGSCTNLTITHCVFTGIGRIACTLMNRGTASDKYDAYKGLVFEHNLGKDLGQTSIYGFLLTLDGYGSQFTVNNNRCENVLGVGIENTGWINGSFIGNRFGVFTRAYNPIGMSQHIMTGLVVSGNSTEGPASSPVYIYNVNDSYFSGNYFETAGGNAVIFRDINRNTIVGDYYKSNLNTACSIEASATTSTLNEFVSCSFDTSLSGTNYSPMRFIGAATTQNTIIGGNINKGTGGVFADQITSATNNYLSNVSRAGTGIRYFNNTSQNFTSDADITLDIQKYAADTITLTDTGTALTTGRNIVFPDIIKVYAVTNSTAQTLTMKTSAGGTVAIATTKTAMINATPTGVIRLTADV